MKQKEGYRSVEAWLSRLGENTQIAQRSYFNQFMKWVNEYGGEYSAYTPDKLLEYQKQISSEDRFELIDKLLQPYISWVKGTFNSKRARTTNVRSFFTHNRAELPRDPNFSIRPDRQPVMGELTPKEIKHSILTSSKAYQAAFMIMFQSALDQEMFTFWNQNGYDNLMAQLRQHPETVKIELPGRKSNRNKRPYYTFIGSDAIDALRNWLEIRPANAEAIITNQRGDPLQKHNLRQYWTRHLRLIGIIPNIEAGKRLRTGKGLHEMRDTFRSLWSKSSASHTVGEYLMGHTIDKLGYDKSFRDVEFYKGEYLKALPFLQLMSRGEAFGRVEKSELERLRKEQRSNHDRVERLEQLLMDVLNNPAALAETKRRLKYTT